MTIKIYGRLSSANVQKVVWFCNEADLSFKSFILGGVHGGTKTDMFIKMNPNSRVPVINDDDYILYESNAILRYLSIKYQFLKSNPFCKIFLPKLKDSKPNSTKSRNRKSNRPRY